MATIPPVWLARSARVAKVSSSIGVILVAGVAMEIERRAHEPLTRYMHAAVCVFLRNTHLLAVGEFVFKQALSHPEPQQGQRILPLTIDQEIYAKNRPDEMAQDHSHPVPFELGFRHFLRAAPYAASNLPHCLN